MGAAASSRRATTRRGRREPRLRSQPFFQRIDHAIRRRGGPGACRRARSARSIQPNTDCRNCSALRTRSPGRPGCDIARRRHAAQRLEQRCQRIEQRLRFRAEARESRGLNSSARGWRRSRPGTRAAPAVVQRRLDVQRHQHDASDWPEPRPGPTTTRRPARSGSARSGRGSRRHGAGRG